MAWGRTNIVRSIRRALFGFARLLAAPLNVIAHASLMRMSSRHTIHGIPVGVLPQENQLPLVARLQAALDLLRELDPRAYRNVRASFRRILILNQDQRRGRAAFSPGSLTCSLGITLVKERADAVLAAAIIHEATHARLERAGIKYWPDLRQRIEARCKAEELAFAKRLPLDRFPNAAAYIRYLSAQAAVPQRASAPGAA